MPIPTGLSPGATARALADSSFTQDPFWNPQPSGFTNLASQMGLYPSEAHWDADKAIELQVQRGQITAEQADYLKGRDVVETGVSPVWAAAGAVPYQLIDEFADPNEQGWRGVPGAMGQAWDNLRGIGSVVGERIQENPWGALSAIFKPQVTPAESRTTQLTTKGVIEPSVQADRRSWTLPADLNAPVSESQRAANVERGEGWVTTADGGWAYLEPGVPENELQRIPPNVVQDTLRGSTDTAPMEQEERLMPIPPGVSPGVAARSTAIPASGNGMFSGIPVAGDIALAGLGSTAFNPAWNYLGAGGAPMTAEAAAEAAAAAKNMTWSQALKADVPHAYQRGYVPPAGQTKLPFWKMPATGGTPATRKLFETATKFLPKAAARFAGPVGAAYGVGDLAYRGTSALLDATGGTGALENLGGSIYNIFNRPKEETANLAAGTLRSPFPPTNTTPTTRRMVRALNPNPLKVDVPRPPGGGGFFAGLGGLLSGAAPAAALGLGLPLGMMWPSKISEEQGIVPESGPLTPQQLFKQRNDLEEIQLRDRPLQEVPEWDPRTSQAGGFFGDLLSKAMSTAQASVSPIEDPLLLPRYVPPSVAPSISLEESIKNELIRDRKKQLQYLPGNPLYEWPPYDPSWNEPAKLPYIRPGLPGRHPEVAAPPAASSARVSQPIIDYPTRIHPPVIQPQAIQDASKTAQPPVVETTPAEDKEQYMATQDALKAEQDRIKAEETRLQQVAEQERRAADAKQARQEAENARQEKERAEQEAEAARNERERGKAEQNRLEALSRQRDAERRAAEAERTRQEAEAAEERKRQQQRESAQKRTDDLLAKQMADMFKAMEESRNRALMNRLNRGAAPGQYLYDI